MKAMFDIVSYLMGQVSGSKETTGIPEPPLTGVPGDYQAVQYLTYAGRAGILVEGIEPNLFGTVKLSFSESDFTRTGQAVFGYRIASTSEKEDYTLQFKVSAGTQVGEAYSRGYDGSLFGVDNIIEQPGVPTKLYFSYPNTWGKIHIGGYAYYNNTVGDTSLCGNIYYLALLDPVFIKTGEVSWRHSFVPCYRKSDNKVGYYDVITNTFYSTNPGSRSITPGTEV